MSKPEKRGTSDHRPLLARILEIPHLARIVPRLQPDVLHRTIERCGLEDCGELLRLATSEQLMGVFDFDLWRRDGTGLDDRFSAARFGVWLEVLVEQGADCAARTLAGLDLELVTAGLAQHIHVFDPAAISLSAGLGGEEAPLARAFDDGLSCEVGGYLIVARRSDAWDAIVEALVCLDADHGPVFHRVMRGCRRLSNSTPEVDGLDDLLTAPEQVMFDLAAARERRRAQQGFATPAEARAFLQLSRQPPVQHDDAPSCDPTAAAYFRHIEEITATAPDREPTHLPSSSAPRTPDDSASAAASLVDVLVAEGVLPQPPRALLDRPDGRATRLAVIQAQLRFAHDRDAAAYLRRSHELAFLANTLMAGCTVQGRPFTSQEASDAAVAVCNLGLENPPTHWRTSRQHPGSARGEALSLPEEFLVGHDLVSVFQVGWSVLYRQVCMYAAEQLVSVLTTLTCRDREIQAGLDALRADMRMQCQAGTPWRARDGLDVMTTLDLPAWAALLGLIAECPVLHAAIGASPGSGVRTVSASAFEFISEHRQIASVRAFMESLSVVLSGSSS